jgi:tetratricopeptide (TPR) repeat protein
LQQAEPLAAASYELAKLDYRAGQFQAALTRLQQIEQAYPNAHMCHWLRCQVETALGNSQVSDDYRLLYALNRAPLPSPLDNFRDRYLIQLKRCALSNFVETQRSQIESGGVRQVQARLEELDKQGYEPQLEDLMANVELALGNQAQQIERLERIIEWDGASTYRCWRLATAYVQVGRDPEAIELLKMGLRLDGRDFVRESREALIELYEKAGDLGRARFHVSRLFGWEGSEALRETRMELAREKLSAAVQMDPSYADAWYDLGIVHGLFGQPDHQRHAFMQCLVANPQHGRAADWLEQHPDVR